MIAFAHLKYSNQVPEIHIIFCSSDGLSPYKGIEFLTEAMIKVHEVIPDATLTIAGGGKLYFNFQKYSNLKYINLINRYVDMEELAHLLQKV